VATASAMLMMVMMIVMVSDSGTLLESYRSVCPVENEPTRGTVDC